MNKINYILVILVIVLIAFIYLKLNKKWKILKPSKMRNDPAGLGHFGASRGSRTHKGLDLICEEGQPFFAPFKGVITRIFNPYTSWQNGGVEIEGTNGTKVKIMYINPDMDLLGQEVRKGQKLGTCANVKLFYPNSPSMLNHIHIEKWQNGQVVDPYNDIF